MADEKKGRAKGDGEEAREGPREHKASARPRRRAAPSARGGEARGPARRPPSSSTAEAVAPRFFEKYKTDVVPALTKQFSYKNPNQVPGSRRSSSTWASAPPSTNPKIIDAAVEELRAITGQKPVVTRAKKAIASFKLRAGIPIGVMVTLRKERMWEFLDRLVTLALPRTRDFRGVPQGLRRQGELHAGSQGTDHLPRDQLRPHRRHQGTQHLLRDDGENR